MAGGIPGLQHVDHAALTVPNLDEAVAFYCEVIGGTELHQSPSPGIPQVPGEFT